MIVEWALSKTEMAVLTGFLLGSVATLAIMICLRIHESNSASMKIIRVEPDQAAGDVPNVDPSWGGR